MRKKIILSILFVLITIWIKCIYTPTCKSTPALVTLNKKIHELDVYKPGGCGIYALYISEYLEKQKIPYKILYVRHIWNLWNKHKVPTHILIQLQPGTYVDAHGFSGYGYTYIFGIKESTHTKQELKELIKTGIWNSKFNKKDSSVIKAALLGD